MSKWIKILYSNKALVDFKNLKWRWSIPLYLLIILITATPFSISLFNSKLSDFIQNPQAFSLDLERFIQETDCQINESAFLICLKDGKTMPSSVFVYTNTSFEIYPQTGTLIKNRVYLYRDRLEITNDKAQLIVIGTYDYLIGYDFKTIKSGLDRHEINPQQMSENFMRSIILSAFGSLAMTRYLALLANYTMFVLIIAFFFRYVSTKRPTVIKFKQSFAMVVQSMFGPALVSTFVGMFLPDQSMLLFLLLFVLRFMWLYQAIIHKKVSLS